MNLMVYELQRYMVEAQVSDLSVTASAVSSEHRHEKKIQDISHLASVPCLQLSKQGGSRSITGDGDCPGIWMRVPFHLQDCLRILSSSEVRNADVIRVSAASAVS